MQQCSPHAEVVGAADRPSYQLTSAWPEHSPRPHGSTKSLRNFYLKPHNKGPLRRPFCEGVRQPWPPPWAPPTLTLTRRANRPPSTPSTWSRPVRGAAAAAAPHPGPTRRCKVASRRKHAHATPPPCSRDCPRARRRCCPPAPLLLRLPRCKKGGPRPRLQAGRAARPRPAPARVHAARAHPAALLAGHGLRHAQRPCPVHVRCAALARALARARAPAQPPFPHPFPLTPPPLAAPSRRSSCPGTRCPSPP